MIKFSKPLATLALALAASSAAVAADLDPVIYADDANLIKPAELGSGWYLRGDLGYNTSFGQEQSFSFSDTTNITIESNLAERVGYGIGAGYQFNSLIRGDITIDRSAFADTSYSGPETFAGSRTITAQAPQTTTALGITTTSLVNVQRAIAFDENGTVFANNCGAADIGCPAIGATINPIRGTQENEATYSLWNVLANGYVDLPVLGRFTPYVGAGAGMSRVNLRASRIVDCSAASNDTCNFPVGDPGEAVEDYVVYDAEDAKWLPTYSLAAGVAFNMTENIKMDLGYRFTQTRGFGDFLQDQGVAVAEDNITNHQFRAGFRISAW